MLLSLFSGELEVFSLTSFLFFTEQRCFHSLINPHCFSSYWNLEHSNILRTCYPHLNSIYFCIVIISWIYCRVTFWARLLLVYCFQELPNQTPWHLTCWSCAVLLVPGWMLQLVKPEANRAAATHRGPGRMGIHRHVKAGKQQSSTGSEVMILL